MRMFRMLFGLTLLMSLPVAATGNNGDLVLNSGSSRVALIELYTSEGCSSCPPADKWLAGLTDDDRLWKDFTPIAFHVDYWDYIGWKDRFAQASFSHRQRRYIDQGGARFVYTPGLFLDGTEWVGWRNNESNYELAADSGVLQLRVSGDELTVRYTPAATMQERLTVHVAVLGMNLESRVRAGENKGRTLRHDFVALGVESVDMQRAAAGFEAKLKMPDIRIEASDRAIVAWVSRAGQEAPLQSVGGYLTRQL
ncbi:MAG: DUF1223 domain-containing protein [Gammaproteobacteria bacterium]|nr:DUF1223 domain-containing protein [Gammaproteobacteria bacterium]